MHRVTWIFAALIATSAASACGGSATPSNNEPAPDAGSFDIGIEPIDFSTQGPGPIDANAFLPEPTEPFDPDPDDLELLGELGEPCEVDAECLSDSCLDPGNGLQATCSRACGSCPDGFVCEMEMCAPDLPTNRRCAAGFFDVNADPADGCETACPGGDPRFAEICNGIDDNCDGQVDETFPTDGMGCNAGIDYCETGTVSCENGGLVCTASANAEPAVERCNDVDDNCDGDIDEGCDAVLRYSNELHVADSVIMGGTPDQPVVEPVDANVCPAGKIVARITVATHQVLDCANCSGQARTDCLAGLEVGCDYLNIADLSYDCAEPVLDQKTGGRMTWSVKDYEAGPVAFGEENAGVDTGRVETVFNRTNIGGLRVSRGGSGNMMGVALANYTYGVYPGSPSINGSWVNASVTNTVGVESTTNYDYTLCPREHILVGFHGRERNAIKEIGAVCRRYWAEHL